MPIRLIDEAGNFITAFPPTNLRQRRVRFFNDNAFAVTGTIQITPPGSTDTTVLGTFTDSPAQQELVISWLNTEYTLTSTGNLVTMPNKVSYNITARKELPAPIQNVNLPFNRVVLNDHLDIASLMGQINRFEFGPSLYAVDVFNKAKELLYNPSVAYNGVEPAETASAISRAMTVSTSRNINTPTGQEIYDTFRMYVLAASVGHPNAKFEMAGSDISNSENANAHTILGSPDYYENEVTQSVVLSSTNRDDDLMGLLVGSRVNMDTSEITLALVYVNLAPLEPRLSLFTVKFPLATPNYPANDTAALSSAWGGISSKTLGTFTGYPASNADEPARNGWLEPPWDAGLFLSTSFDNGVLRVRAGIPGARPSDNWLINVAEDLTGYSPTAGLCVQSQIGGLWKDYTIVS